MAGSLRPRPRFHLRLLRAILWQDAMQSPIRRGIQILVGIVVDHRRRAKSRVSSCWPGQLKEEAILAVLANISQPQYGISRSMNVGCWK